MNHKLVTPVATVPGAMRTSIVLATALAFIVAIAALLNPAGATDPTPGHPVCSNCWNVPCGPGNGPGVTCQNCVEVPCAGQVTVKSNPRSSSSPSSTGQPGKRGLSTTAPTQAQPTLKEGGGGGSDGTSGGHATTR